MSLISRLLGIRSGPHVDLATDESGNQPPERRGKALTSWDLMRGLYDVDAGVPVNPHLAENLSAVYGCVQAISYQLHNGLNCKLTLAVATKLRELSLEPEFNLRFSI